MKIGGGRNAGLFTSRCEWQLMRLSRLEGKSPLQEAPCQYILSANGTPHANRRTSMDHDPALRGRCYMLVSHICEIVAGRLYADCLVTVPCVLTPPRVFWNTDMLLTAYHQCMNIL